MFENNCADCWHGISNFLSHTLNDTSPEGLFKSLVVLAIIVAGAYGIFAGISYVSNLVVNFARKLIFPVLSMALVFFLLTVAVQLREGKTCRFSIERYITQCIPKGRERELDCDSNDPLSDECLPTTHRKKSGATTDSQNSWGGTELPPTRGSWNSVSPPPKNKTSTTKSAKNVKNHSTDKVRSDRSRKNCDTPKKSSTQNRTCDTATTTTEPATSKDRDYSEQ
ncbi:MAG: hypothetical protein R3E08_02670 [Thiotrichaceae bacterium]